MKFSFLAFAICEIIFLFVIPPISLNEFISLSYSAAICGFVGGLIIKTLLKQGAGAVQNLAHAKLDSNKHDSQNVGRDWKQEREERRKREREEQNKEQRQLIDSNKSLSAEEILLKKELNDYQKRSLLTEIHKYSWGDAEELIKISEKAQQKARLDSIKRKVVQKAQEKYGNIPTDDTRKPIPDDVKMFVWQRDGGKCVKCGHDESLEFDHIIPVAKGGSNTERNIQLLCEKCNREKKDNIQ